MMDSESASDVIYLESLSLDGVTNQTNHQLQYVFWYMYSTFHTHVQNKAKKKNNTQTQNTKQQTQWNETRKEKKKKKKQAKTSILHKTPLTKIHQSCTTMIFVFFLFCSFDVTVDVP
jgi:Fe2+ transport system protein B